VGVLDGDGAGDGDVGVGPVDERLDEARVDAAVLAGPGAGGDPAERGGGAHLEVDDVRLDVGEQLLAGADEELQADLVGHGPGRGEHGRFLAEQGGGFGFEGVHRGVLAVDVVADVGGRHGFEHARGRAGHGVGTEVDDHDPILAARLVGFRRR